VRKLDTLALILTIVGGLNWGLVGLFRFDLVAAIFGGMEFGETNLASRIVYAAVGLSAVYLLGRIRTLVGNQERVPPQPELRRYANAVRRRFGQAGPRSRQSSLVGATPGQGRAAQAKELCGERGTATS
jgi:uncharacterized membrane protein YuzA (DUF378 family)